MNVHIKSSERCCGFCILFTVYLCALNVNVFIIFSNMLRQSVASGKLNEFSYLLLIKMSKSVKT